MRERLLPITIIALYLIYFLTFVAGGPRARSAYQGPTGETLNEEEAYAVIEDDDPMADLEAIQNQRIHDVYWRPGLFAQLVVMNRARDLIEDELLESDARPEKLFRNLERSRTGLLFALALALFWCGAHLLSLVALVRNQWFARPMTLYTITPSMFFLLIYLLAVQRERLSLMDGNAYLLVGVAIETLLFFLGAFLVMSMLIPGARRAAVDDRFMSHQFLKGAPLGRRLGGFLRAAGQIVVIGAGGLLISNLLLLPIFSLQLNFPTLFTGLIVFGVLVLVIFYTSAYVRVSRKDDYQPDHLLGLTFLGFRMQKNTLFLLSIIALIVVILSSIVLVSYANINLLETFGLLERPQKL